MQLSAKTLSSRSHVARLLRAMILTLLAGLLTGLAAPGAQAGVDSQFPEVRAYFPHATRFGDIKGKPPAATVYDGKKVIGYVFESRMVAPVPAYSGEPVNILVAIDTKGQIVGTKVLEQHEPILLVGIPVQKLYDFVDRYVGHKVTESISVGGGSGGVSVDAISSATVTSMAVNETLMNSALKVAVARHVVAKGAAAASGPAAKVRANYYKPAGWTDLTGNGALRRLHLTRGQVVKAFKGKPESGLIDDVTAPAPGHDADTFINLFYADITPPTVGQNMLGKDAYAALRKKLKPGDEAIAVMANGLYSFMGTGYVRGGIFDRIHVLQDNKVFLFQDIDYVALTDPQMRGMPGFKEKSIFILKHGHGFDPGRPWTFQLLVRRQIGPLKSIYATFNGSYQIPAAYVVRPAVKTSLLPANAPMWMKIWYARRDEVAVLLAGLSVLSLILIFQDWLVKRPKLLERTRIGFLIYTAVFIGWYGLAQLSVVNVLTFVHSVLNGFHWSLFLMDPLIFILWVFVAVSLLLVGRGVYCGWLCPFGALQTLISTVARHFHVPQIEVPSYVHERLWAIKYVVLLFLFGLSLQSVGLAERFAEIEPFKTAISLHFMRSWGYVVYAVFLLAASAFNSKFYCRYMCPLGASLAISGRFRQFEWLRRRRECGRPCQICANECEVRAINDIGQINFNECHYCLDCQVTYWNDEKCPPLVSRRKKRDRVGTVTPEALATAAARTGQPPAAIGLKKREMHNALQDNQSDSN